MTAMCVCVCARVRVLVCGGVGGVVIQVTFNEKVRNERHKLLDLTSKNCSRSVSSNRIFSIVIYVLF